jgi:Fe-S cluster assembly protein SufD
MTAAIALKPQHGPIEAYVEQYGALRRVLPGADLPWLASLRDAAIVRFQSQGFPTTKQEAWKFTNLSRLTAQSFEPAADRSVAVAPSQLAHARLAGICELQMVFVNGHFRADLSDPQLQDPNALPAGVRIMSFVEALRDAPALVESHIAEPDTDAAEALANLNAALATDGGVIHLTRNAKLTQPLHLLFLTVPGDAPSASHLRNLIIAEDGAEVTVVESYTSIGAGGYWTNAVTQVAASQGAIVRHYKRQSESLTGFHTSSSDVEVQQDATYESFVLATGGNLARHEVRARLLGDRAAAILNGVYLGRDHLHQAQRTDVEHRAVGTKLSELYKGVFDERAHGAFLGRIHVAEDAQKTDAQQQNRNLLLSDGAVADTKPELEINADDVKCAHGATVGDLDREPLFYLRARGIDETDARALLIQAFICELIDSIKEEPVHAYFRNAFAHWLEEEGITPP